MWMIMCTCLTGFVVAHWVMTYVKGGLNDFRNQLLCGFPISFVNTALLDDPESVPKWPVVTWKKALEKFYLFVVVIIVIFGEAALPTHQVFPEWLYVDIWCTGGAQLFWVILPRSAFLGFMEHMHHACEITLPYTHGAVWFTVFLTVLGAGIASTINTSFSGEYNRDLEYWLLPPCCLILSGLMLTLWLTYFHGKCETPAWCKQHKVQMTTTSRLSYMCLLVCPPHWLQILLSMEVQRDLGDHLAHLPYNRFVKLGDNLLIEWNPDSEEKDADEIFVLDGPNAGHNFVAHERVNMTQFEQRHASTNTIYSWLLWARPWPVQ